MQRYVIHCLQAALSTAALAVPAIADLEWRVSVKIFLDANGNRPVGELGTDAQVQGQFSLGNAALAATGRGYQLRLTEIVELNDLADWFTRDIFAFKDALEQAAEANPAEFAWRENAINVYINGFAGPGVCSFPNDEVIFLGQEARSTSIMHEIGHFYALCHTQGCACGSCDPQANGECHTTPGDDSIADTLPDLECFDRDDIANFTFGQNYAQLTSAQQRQVDAVIFNIMSYHDTRDRFTDDQMDKMTDVSNEQRPNETNGRTRFVDHAGNPFLQFGSSTLPFVTVAGGVNDADDGDIVLIREGTYDEVLEITKQVTLRASRGTTVIGT